MTNNLSAETVKLADVLKLTEAIELIFVTSMKKIDSTKYTAENVFVKVFRESKELN